MNDLELRRLRSLAQKWAAQGNHPQNSRNPERRELLLKCAAELMAALHPADPAVASVRPVP